MSPHTNVTHAWTLAFLLAGFLSLVLLIHFQRILNGNWVWWLTPVIPLWVSLAYSETLSQKEERKKVGGRKEEKNNCCRWNEVVEFLLFLGYKVLCDTVPRIYFSKDAFKIC